MPLSFVFVDVAGAAPVDRFGDGAGAAGFAVGAGLSVDPRCAAEELPRPDDSGAGGRDAWRDPWRDGVLAPVSDIFARAAASRALGVTTASVTSIDAVPARTDR